MAMDVVAVNQLSLFIAEQHAVGVAVVRDAEVRLMFGDLVAHLRRVHGAAVLVDVHAVGTMAVNDDLRAEFVQHGGRGFVGRAVGAIPTTTRRPSSVCPFGNEDLANSM